MPIITMSSQGLEAIEDAVEAISSGIFMLRGHRDTLDGLSASALVDIAARLDAQYEALQRLLEPIRSRLISRSLLAGPTVLGTFYQAEVSREKVYVLLDRKVREFLGRDIYRVEEEKEDIRIKFKVKE